MPVPRRLAEKSAFYAIIIMPLACFSYAMTKTKSFSLLAAIGLLLLSQQRSALAAAPTCNAGSETVVAAGHGSYQLDGSGSTGTGLTYSWSQLTGFSTATWDNRSIARPTVSYTAAGAYMFQLTVTDGNSQTATCTVTIVAPPAPGYPRQRNLHNPNLTSGIGAFTTVTSPAIKNWQAHHFDSLQPYANDFAYDPRGYDPNITFGGYIDSAFMYAYQMPDLITSATNHGFAHEDAFLHATADWKILSTAWPTKHWLEWTDLESFDAFDPAGNGVLTLNGGVYTDKTTAAYSTGNVSWGSGTDLLIGYTEPYDEINFNLSAVAAGTTVTATYWNGSSYSTLALGSDGTNGFTQSGKIRFSVPGDWKIHSENGGKAKYWIKWTITGGSANPTAALIYGAGWLYIPLSDTRQLSWSSQFNQINVRLRSSAVGATVTYSYSTGPSTWGALTLSGDTTLGLTQDGTISFTPPGDWTPAGGFYKIRINVSGGGAAVATRLWPNSGACTTCFFYTDAATDAMGWSATDPNRINVGTPLEYNPNPPSGADAHFRYQARAGGIWAENSMLGSPAAVDGSGNHLWAEYLLDQINTMVGQFAFDGYGLDDLGSLPPGLPQANMDIPASPDVQTQILGEIQWFVTALQAARPGLFVGFNSGGVSDAQALTLSANPPVYVGHESAYHSYVVDVSGLTAIFSGWHSLNTGHVEGGYSCFDTISTVFDFGSFGGFRQYFPWDKADHAPMTCLAMHYIAETGLLPNGVPEQAFIYNPNGYVYNETGAEVYSWSANPTNLTTPITNSACTTLSSDLVPAQSWNAKTVPVASTAPFPNNGTSFYVQVGSGPTGRLLWSTMNGGNLVATTEFYYPSVAAGTKVCYVGNAGGTTIAVGSTAGATIAAPMSGSIILRLGDPGATSGDFVTATIVDGTHFNITGNIANDYTIGTPVYMLQSGWQYDPLPPLSRIWKWSAYFPAMGINLGAATGPANLTWKAGVSVTSDPSICMPPYTNTGLCGNIARRDFANGVVFVKAGYGDDPTFSHTNSWLDVVTPTVPICIHDGDTYPNCTGPYYQQLHADASLGPPTQSFTLTGLSGIIMLPSTSTATSTPDTTPPTIQLLAPSPNSTVSSTVTVSGTASDNVGVTSVSVSIDGGTFMSALGTSAWSFTWNTGLLPNGSHTISAKATDAADNTATSPTITVNVQNPVSSFQTIFTTQTPSGSSYSDGVSTYYELGTRFIATVNGQLTAIRFYKSASESGIHTGRIWSTSGQQLASVVFSGETPSGWQQQSLTTPLNIVANTEYMVTVDTPNTYFAATISGLNSQVNNGNLQTIVGNNGRYGPVGSYPTNSWQNSNYFRDVVFMPTSTLALAPDTTAPTISIASPLAGTVSGSITFSATASDPVTSGQVVSGLRWITLFIDGSIFATSTTSPASRSLDTTTLTNGGHTLAASAIDNAGNLSSVASVSVTVNNVSSQKYPRLVALTSLEGLPAIPANQPITATILSGGTVLETQTNLLPNGSKQYTVTFLASDPQIVNIRAKTTGYLSQLLSNVDTTTNSAIALSVPQLFAGDLNNDNAVNALDYSLMNSHWLQNFSQADINRDGLINSLDFAVLKNDFGKNGQ